MSNLARTRDADLSVLHHFEVGVYRVLFEDLYVLLWIVLGSGGSVNGNGSIIIVDNGSRSTNVFIHLIILVIFGIDPVVGGRGRGGGRLVHVRVKHVGIDDYVQIRATLFTLYRVVDPSVRVYENRGTILVVSYHRSLRFPIGQRIVALFVRSEAYVDPVWTAWLRGARRRIRLWRNGGRRRRHESIGGGNGADVCRRYSRRVVRPSRV